MLKAVYLFISVDSWYYVAIVLLYHHRIKGLLKSNMSCKHDRIYVISTSPWYLMLFMAQGQSAQQFKLIILRLFVGII